MTDVLVICGAAGVGKSSVAHEVSRSLNARGVLHALIDTDELDRIYPVPDDLPAVTEANLRALWTTFAQRGVARLILVGVYLDKPSERDWITRAIPGAKITAIRLTAARSTLVARVHDRERGSGLEDQLTRTLGQLGALEEYQSDAVRIATDGLSVVEIAATVTESWAGIPGR